MSAPSLTLLEIAAAIGAALPPDSDPALVVTGAAALEDAQPGEVAFFEHPKYLRALRATKAGVVLVPLAFDEPISAILLRVADPSAAFSILLTRLAAPITPDEPGIHPAAIVHATAEIHPTACIHPGAVIAAGAKIGARTSIGAQAFIGLGAQVGEDCLIHPHAVLREGTILGARVIIHSCAVLGSDGFGFRFAEGRHHKVIHRGHVQIDDDVEVGACTTIDRARFGRTWIQAGTKIDNLVQIAHNVVIGPHCLIVSQTGISGSARLGKYVTLAGQVGVVGHIEIGDQVIVTAKSGVSKDAEPKQVLMGTYGIPIKEARELVAHYHRQPKTVARLKELETEVQTLKALVQELLQSRTPASSGEPAPLAL
jgi:UDP-3-O-[3-hydroxymyristoyl] glucosamine N-acyltransferase